MVRAKFKVIRIESTQYSRLKPGETAWMPENIETVEMRTIVFHPATGGSEENKVFWNATPSGEIRLGTINPEAWKGFELGKEYYVNFIPGDPNNS